MKIINLSLEYLCLDFTDGIGLEFQTKTPKIITENCK